MNRWNLDPRQLPRAARINARYGIEKFVTMPHEDLRNPTKFEEILAAGHEIIFAINLHANSDDSATGQPVWRLKPRTPGSSINHFMLMVGYNRHRRFFVVKNQWGPTNYSGRVNKLRGTGKTSSSTTATRWSITTISPNARRLNSSKFRGLPNGGHNC